MFEHWEARGTAGRVLVALLAVAGAVLLRLALGGVVGPRTPFMTFYPAMMAAALFGGAVSGLLATGLLGLLAYFWVLPQLNTFIIDSAAWLALAAYLLSGALVSGLAEALHRARRRTARAEAQAELSAERSRAETALQRLAAIVEASGDAIIGAGLDGVTLTWNSGAQRIYGYTAEEAIGRHASMLCPPGRANEIAGVLERLAAGERVLHYETVRQHKNGALVPVSVTISAIRDAGGAPTGLSAVVRDITERKRAEEALHESEERFRKVVECTDNLVTQVDGQGRFLYVNPMSRAVFGLEPEDCVGRMAFDFIHPGDREATTRAFDGWVAARRASASIENRQISLAGEVRHLSWTIDLHYDGGGNVAFIDSIAQDITERTRAEAALRESEAFARTIIESSPDCIKMLNSAGELIFMSQGGLNLLGIDDPGTVLGQPYMAFWKGTEQEHCLSALEAARQGRVGRFEGYCPTARGVPKWWEVTISPLSGPDGKPDRFLVISRDVTGRKMAADALRAEKDRLAAIIDTSPDMMFLKDMDLRYLAANAAHEAILGLRPADMLGRTDEELLPPGLAESCRASDLAALKDGSVLQEEQVGEHWYCVSKRRVQDAGGTVLGVAALITDITERRRAYDALRQSEELFRQLVESAPDAIFVQTRGSFAYANAACLKLYGAERPEALLGGQVLARFHADYHERASERIRSVNEQRKPVPPMEQKHLRLDGSCVDVEVSAVPLLYGGVNGALVFVRDISERKRVEALREDMERIARHDLKTPLNAVINLPLLLMDDTGLTPEQTSYLRLIHEAGLRMLEQIDQSLTLYRIETGSFQLEPQAVDLAELTRQVARELSSTAASLGVELAVEAQQHGLLASGDALLCRTMLSNLLKNAVEAAPKGTRALARLTQEDGHAVVDIHNAGTVPEDLRPRFFEKYASSGKKRGAGLGTYSARLSAEAQGGSIRLISAEAQGTTVTIRLPLTQAVA